jgi:hypothetical protein
MYGKIKENRPVVGEDTQGRKSYQKFSDWVVIAFPGICTKNDVPAALWFAQDFPHHEEIPAGISHPRNIREWFNEQQAAATPDPFEATPDHEEETPSLSAADAEYLREFAAVAPVA